MLATKQIVVTGIITPYVTARSLRGPESSALATHLGFLRNNKTVATVVVVTKHRNHTVMKSITLLPRSFTVTINLHSVLNQDTQC